MKFNEHIYYAKLDFRIPLLGKDYLPCHTYSVLLKFGKKVLIDTGVTKTQEQLELLMAEAGVSYHELDSVINTHSHPDHIGLNRIISEKNRNIIFYSHPEAVPVLEDIALQNGQKYLVGLLSLLSGEVHGVIPLSDGQKFYLGGETLEIFFTPGHSNDSISFFLANNKMLIAGDSIVDSDTAPNYTDLAQLRRSLELLSKVPCDYILSSVAGLVEKSKNDIIKKAFRFLDTVDVLVREKCKQTRDVDIIARHVLDKLRLPFSIDYIVRASVAQHILSGEAKGKVHSGKEGAERIP